MTPHTPRRFGFWFALFCTIIFIQSTSANADSWNKYWTETELYGDYWDKIYDFADTEFIELVKNTKHLVNKQDKPPQDILNIYRAEKIMGHQIGPPKRLLCDTDYFKKVTEKFPYYEQIGKYIHDHRKRFKEIHDCWKGDDNWVGPTTYWLDYISKQYPNSDERWEIEWDQIYYGDLTKCQDFDTRAIGKTCEKYYQEMDGDISQATPCEELRTKFGKRLEQLIQKYRGTPIERELRKVDPTAIIYVMGC